MSIIEKKSCCNSCITCINNDFCGYNSFLWT